MSSGSSLDSAGSVELPNAPNGNGWGGGVPMDLVCLHGTGDPHGNSGSYTKSLSGSSCSLGRFGVGSCLKHLVALGLVSQKVPPPPPPDKLTQCGNLQLMHFFW